jgi:hypothetical protein
MTPTIIKTSKGLLVTGLSPLETRYVIDIACAALKAAIPVAHEFADAAIMDQMLGDSTPVGLLA